jgi:hypothetical protein
MGGAFGMHGSEEIFTQDLGGWEPGRKESDWKA